MELNGRCAQHGFQPARGVCPQCGYEYCVECLAYPRGKDKKPICVGCANRGMGFHRDPRSRKRMSMMKRRQRYRLHKLAEAERLSGSGKPKTPSDESVA